MINNSEKRYDVRVSFKLKGNVPDMVSVERISEHIRSALIKNCGHMYIHGEFYNCYDKEWLLTKIGTANIDVRECVVNYKAIPSCQNCGDAFKEFGVEVSNGEISCCLDCAKDKLSISDEEYAEIREHEKELSISHHEKLIRKLKNK